jgi:hypothetical protein
MKLSIKFIEESKKTQKEIIYSKFSIIYKVSMFPFFSLVLEIIRFDSETLFAVEAKAKEKHFQGRRLNFQQKICYRIN